MNPRRRREMRRRREVDSAPVVEQVVEPMAEVAEEKKTVIEEVKEEIAEVKAEEETKSSVSYWLCLNCEKEVPSDEVKETNGFMQPLCPDCRKVLSDPATKKPPKRVYPSF